MALTVGRDLAGVVAGGEVGGPGAAAESFDTGPGVVAAGADDRDVEDGDLDLVVGSADVVAVPAQDGRLVADRVEVGAHVAGVGPASGDAQRTPLAAAAHDQRQRAERPRVARGLGQRDPFAVVRLGAGRPQGPQRLGGDREVVEALRRGREGAGRTPRARGPTTRRRDRRRPGRR